MAETIDIDLPPPVDAVLVRKLSDPVATVGVTQIWAVLRSKSPKQPGHNRRLVFGGLISG